MDQKTSNLTDINRHLTRLLARPSETTLASVPDGMAGKALADLASATGTARLLFVASDGQRLAEIERGLRFFAPQIELVEFPAWDCLPYDRVSPHAAIVARRMAALALSRLTTVNAALQRRWPAPTCRWPA